MAEGVGDIQRARCVDREPLRLIERGSRADAVLPTRNTLLAGERGDHPCRCDPAQQAAPEIGHVDIAVRIDGDAAGIGESRGVPGSIGGAGRSRPCKGRDHPGGGDLANSMVLGVRHVEVA
ncbi:hypothetical protein D9M72_414790 [compost metagenome]